jgi:DNA-binding transcriptional LysR family regulator
LDLTLLLVFLGLIRHRKALDVAVELGLTQSAISQALKRLRQIFGEELFLRRPYGLEPTATALALEQPISRAVESLRGALVAARAFDPSHARGTIRIAALDAEQAVLVPSLSSELERQAPGLQLSVLPLGRISAMEALVEGRVDIALGLIPQHMPLVISSRRLYIETYRVVGQRHALPDAPHVDLDAYCAADHVLVSPGGDLRGIVDEALESIGRSRRIVLGLPAFLPALAAVACSDRLVTLPARVAGALAPGFGLVTAEPPLTIRSFPVSVYWHRRNETDPRTPWLVGLLESAVAWHQLS